MQHADHVGLLRGGITETGGVWADLGAGAGAFTLALADQIGPGGQIYSLDRDRRALGEQEQAMRARFPGVAVQYLVADLGQRQPLPPLDCLVMANSLHFQRKKEPVLELVQSYLKPGGRLILVEYNTDAGNPWVPYPLSYPTWEALARKVGLLNTRLLATVPSRWLGEIYAAVSLRRSAAPAPHPASTEAGGTRHVALCRVA
jgi:ubiquinone/menaquinone biosynthesis C-methylase UbiE